MTMDRKRKPAHKVSDWQRICPESICLWMQTRKLIFGVVYPSQVKRTNNKRWCKAGSRRTNRTTADDRATMKS